MNDHTKFWKEVSPGAYVYVPSVPLAHDSVLVLQESGSVDEIRQRRLKAIRLELLQKTNGVPDAQVIFLEGDPDQPFRNHIVPKRLAKNVATLSNADALALGISSRSWSRSPGPGERMHPHPSPKALATVLALLMAKPNCTAFIGDLEERYGVLLQHEGRRAAIIWFWREVAYSFISLALDAVKRISGLEKLMRRIGS